MEEKETKEYLVGGYWFGDRDNASCFIILATSPEEAMQKIQEKNPNFETTESKVNPY